MDAQSGVRPKTGPGSPGASAGTSGGQTTTESQQKDEVSDLVEQAKRTATETASGAGSMVRQRIDDQYHKLGERLDDMIEDMNKVADGLEKEGSSSASNLMHSATRRMERVSGYLQRTSAEDAISDANQYARQHAGTVIAAGMIVGLIASRFLKAAMPPEGEPMGGGSPGGRSGEYPAGTGYESGTSYHAGV